MARLVVTGAAGGIGAELVRRFVCSAASRAPLGGDDLELLLIDRAAVPIDALASEAGPRVQAAVVDITDHDTMAAALVGADAVLHLAGNRFVTAPWSELAGPNLDGPRVLLEAAVEAGVRRVVLASSCHASGGHDRAGRQPVDPTWAPRPCCRYGATKAWQEMLGRYRSDTSDLSVVALRYGAVSQLPVGPVGREFWLSLDDLESVTVAALTAPVRFGVYFAASANARHRWDLTPGERDLGYRPADDAAAHPVDQTLDPGDCYRGVV